MVVTCDSNNLYRTIAARDSLVSLEMTGDQPFINRTKLCSIVGSPRQSSRRSITYNDETVESFSKPILDYEYGA